MTEDEAVLHANEAFYAALNAKDIVAMEAVWARDAPIACIHPGWNVLAGSEQVMASWRAILANPNQPRVVSGGERVQVEGEVAVVICREMVDGAPLAATNVFVRETGAWRMLHHHSSAIALV
ncbi:MAG: DUF4440 domain-containing protein [Dehalococcoidia bacterium]|nr:DUF4440 domain-containing protein [Dehalococcoidia bacterium]